MFSAIDTLIKSQRRLVVLFTAFTLALAVLATHSVVGAPHHSEHEGHTPPTNVVLTICLAVLEVGVALTISLFWLIRRRPATDVPQVVVFAPMAAPAPNGLAPPGRLAALLQVFLR